MGTCVITDPSAVMPHAWRTELPIHLVPLDIAWPDGTTQPGDAPYSAIAERLEAATRPPTTGAPSPGTYGSAITDLLRTHDGVVVVCPSSDMSMTFRSATLGAQGCGDDRVRVLDSKTAAAGQGLVAAEAARVAASGGSLDDACHRAVDVASRVEIWATLAQLGFLKRSGRVPAVAAFGAGALGLHPIVRYAGGSPVVAGVVRSSGRAVERLFGAWHRSVSADAELQTIAFHSAREDDARRLLDRIAAQYGSARSDVVEVSASLASHTGPGLLGLAWFWDN